MISVGDNSVGIFVYTIVYSEELIWNNFVNKNRRLWRQIPNQVDFYFLIMTFWHISLTNDVINLRVIFFNRIGVVCERLFGRLSKCIFSDNNIYTGWPRKYVIYTTSIMYLIYV